MSNEIKAVSFRLIDEDIQKFREIADEQGLNQAEMFQGLMNNFEMAKAKGMITDRSKEIEVFQDTVNTLVSMFINSLAINQTSEERIRETLSLELNTKDKTIADLQEYKEKTKDQLKTNKEEIKSLEDVGNDLRYTLDKTNKELDQKTSIVDNQQDQINTLNSIVTEYKQYKDINKDLELKSNELNTKVTDVLHSNADLESKIENLESMKNFYKSEVDSLKNEIKELNTNIKLIEQTSKEEIKTTEKAYKDELKALEEEHRVKISNLKKELADKFNEELADKLEVEKSKYELKLDKAINKEQLLRINYDNLKAQYDKDIVKNKK